MAEDLAAQNVADAHTADRLPPPTKEFLVVSVSNTDPVMVEYKTAGGRSNRRWYKSHTSLLQDLLNQGWRIERQFGPVCDASTHEDKADWQPHIAFILSKLSREETQVEDDESEDD